MTSEPQTFTQLEAFAKQRAEHLAGAYDIDEGTREAFIWDVTQELVQCVTSFMKAMEQMPPGVPMQARNRHQRRAIESAMRKGGRA